MDNPQEYSQQSPSSEIEKILSEIKKKEVLSKEEVREKAPLDNLKSILAQAEASVPIGKPQNAAPVVPSRALETEPAVKSSQGPHDVVKELEILLQTEAGTLPALAFSGDQAINRLDELVQSFRKDPKAVEA